MRLALGSDVVITGASVSDDYKIEKEADGTWLNEYQMRMRQGDVYVEVMDYPLARAETKADIEAYRFPDTDAPGRFRDAEALVKKYKNDYLIIGDIEVTIFSLAQQLVGMEKLLIDMMMETEYVVPLFEACTEFQTQIGLRLIDKGVDAIWFGDKFAFWGAIDQQDLLPNGSDEELERDIIEKISILGKDGGYMIAPAHIIQNDVTPSRVLRFIELCKIHGKYYN